jgi:hypothetical protein
MAVGILNDNPNLTPEFYDAVNDKMDVSGNPPAGLIFHSAGVADSGFRIFDVWQSQDAFDRFVEERLRPAVDELSEGQGPAQMPQVEIYELHNFIAP